MIIDGHNRPCYFADGFCKPTTKTLVYTTLTIVWFSNYFCLIFTLQDFIGRMTKNKDRYWIETDFLYILHIHRILIQHLALKEHHILMYMLHIHKTLTILFFHVLTYFQMFNFLW